MRLFEKLIGGGKFKNYILHYNDDGTLKYTCHDIFMKLFIHRFQIYG